MLHARGIDERMSEVQRQRESQSRKSKYIEDYDDQYTDQSSDVYPEHSQGSSEYPERYAGGAGFLSKAFHSANRFARQTGIISKGLEYAGAPTLAKGARALGYGAYQQGSGIVGGVAPVYKQSAEQRKYSQEYRQSHPRQRKTNNPLSAWQKFVKMNYSHFRDEAIKFLNSTEPQDDEELFGHSPPNGRDIQRVTFVMLGYSFKHNGQGPEYSYVAHRLLEPTASEKRAEQGLPPKPRKKRATVATGRGYYQ